MSQSAKPDNTDAITGAVIAALLVLTAGWIVSLILVAKFSADPPGTFNAWGDYLAGWIQPAAVAWFVAALILQARQIRLQRQELQLQRQELKEARHVQEAQRQEQERLAEATIEANDLARRGQFFAMLPPLEAAIEDAARDLLIHFDRVAKEERAADHVIVRWANQYILPIRKKEVRAVAGLHHLFVFESPSVRGQVVALLHATSDPRVTQAINRIWATLTHLNNEAEGLGLSSMIRSEILAIMENWAAPRPYP